MVRGGARLLSRVIKFVDLFLKTGGYSAVTGIPVRSPQSNPYLDSLWLVEVVVHHSPGV